MGRMRLTAALCGALLLGTAAHPVFGQSADPALEELKRQVQQAQEALKQQQAVIEALQGRISDLEKSKSETISKDELKAQVAAEVKKSSPQLPESLKGLKVGTTTFLSFQNGSAWSGVKNETSATNAFTVKRAYLDASWSLTPWLTARVTPDVFATTVSGGQYVVRLKYAYANFHWKGNDYASAPQVEGGIIRTPWIDFEEQLNRFRMVEATFLDRMGVMASADLGLAGGANLGPELDAAYKRDVNDKYAGRWGSFALGFYNGGGYTTGEKNQNKVFQWRLSVRPFGEMVPALTGLQLHWAGSQGKGNVAPNTSVSPVVAPPDLTANYVGLTYQSKYVNAEAMWYNGRGNMAGTAVDISVPGRPALPQKGYTAFAEVRFPESRTWSAFVRYDRFDPDTDQPDQFRKDIQTYTDVGVAFWMFKQNALVLDYSFIQHTRPWPGQPAGLYQAIPDDQRWQLTCQIKF